MEYLEKTFKTISKFKLIEKGDKIFVALSGGKDSAAALFSLTEYARAKGINCEIKGLHLNFGLPISNQVEDVVKKQASMAGVELISINLNDVGVSLKEAVKKSRRPICSTCGVIKRYMLNRVARELGATKLATGHNMDDFIVFFFKNLIGKNFSWISKFRPRVDATNAKLVCKIRPLFFTSQSEDEKFCLDNNIPFLEEDVCPHSYIKCKIDLNRDKWFRLIEDMEKTQTSRRNSLALLSNFLT